MPQGARRVGVVSAAFARPGIRFARVLVGRRGAPVARVQRNRQGGRPGIRQTQQSGRRHRRLVVVGEHLGACALPHGLTGEARPLAFEVAYAVRQVEIGLAGLLSLLGGLTLTAFGLAVLRSARYPAWLGAIGLLDGLGMAAAGAAQASTGFSGLAMALSTVASSVFLAWAVLAGVLMRRWAIRSGGDGDAA